MPATQLVWFITGCSSGFGLQFVHSILARGDLVIATARKLASIEPLSSLPGVHILQLDITSPQPEIDKVIETAIAIHGHIDVLVNNAAHVQIGVWEHLESEDWVRQFDTNVFGTIKVTKAILPHLRARKAGTMVFISSINGFVAHPGVGPYSASKHALEGAVESLANETTPLGLKTLLIEPGRFRTNLLSPTNVQIKDGKKDELQSDVADSGDYAGFYESSFPSIAAESGNQPGDPSKLVSIVLDLVRNEGVAEGREIPLRMFLGSDAWDEVGAKLRKTIQDFEDWEQVTKSTDRVVGS